MSDKCFVTKLANSVDKDNLLKLGELRLRFKKPENGILKNIFNGLKSTNNVVVSFPYESEHLNFVDTGSNNRLIGKYFNITGDKLDKIGIQVSEPYDREYIDVSFIPFYYLGKITSQFSNNILGFIDSNGNYVGFKPFKYTNIRYLALDFTKFSGVLDDIPKTATYLGFDNTQVTGDISNLKDMVGITYLGLKGTQVTGDITELVNNMTKLTTISIPSKVTITDAQKKTLTDRGCTVIIS